MGEGFVRLVAEGQTGDMLVIMPGTHITLSADIENSTFTDQLQ